MRYVNRESAIVRTLANPTIEIDKLIFDQPGDLPVTAG